MAKQRGAHSFTGKLGATIGYRLKNGEYIERENGSKEGRAFKKDPRRWRTMHNAGLFGQASKIVSRIYRALPKDQQQHGVYGKLSGKAFSMLRLGSSIEEVKVVLIKRYVEDKEPLVYMTQKAEAGVSACLTASATAACTNTAISGREKRSSHWSMRWTSGWSMITSIRSVLMALIIKHLIYHLVTYNKKD